GQVPGIDVSGETPIGLVRIFDRLVDIAEGHDRRDRPEDLFREDVLVGLDVAQHGRRHEVPRPAGRLAAGQDAGAVTGRLVDQAEHFLARGIVDYRSDLYVRVEPRSHR